MNNFFLKNIDTNEIIKLKANSYESLSKNFRTAPYILASSAEQESEILKEAKSTRLLSRENYLAKHDKLWIRKLRENIDVPSDIVTKSNQARAEHNAIEALTTLAEVEAYSETFE